MIKIVCDSISDLPQEIIDKYDKNTKVIYIAGSSIASGTYQSAMLAKNDGHDNVFIFDSKNYSK